MGEKAMGRGEEFKRLKGCTMHGHVLFGNPFFDKEQGKFVSPFTGAARRVENLKLSDR
jgi:hypothetical protein